MSQSVADRASRLQTRRHESGILLRSRKRKLRELYLITTDPAPVPQLRILTPVDKTDDEARFLDDSDLTKGRKFDDSALPPKRTLRSDTQRRINGAAASTKNAPPDGLPSSSSTLAPDDAARRSRGTTPRADASTTPAKPATPTTTPRRGRSATSPRNGSTNASKAPEPEPPVPAPTLESVPDVTMEDASEPTPTDAQQDAMEADRIKKTVESPPGSPGVNPRRALPISPGEAALLKEPLVDSILAQDPHHKAATIHLPPKEVMEARRLEKRQAERAHRAAENDHHAPARIVTDTATIEAASSPGSTVGAQSATTPALHEVSSSTDTSPENEGPRFPERADEKTSLPQTPPALDASTDATADRQTREGLLQAQIAASRQDILESSPTTADAQLRFEERQANASKSNTPGGRETSSSTTAESALVHNAREFARDLAGDEAEEDEVVGVPTPDEVVKPSDKVAVEIADTDASSQESAEAMDVDSKERNHGNGTPSKVPTITTTITTTTQDKPIDKAETHRKTTSDVLHEIDKPNVLAPSEEMDYEPSRLTPSAPPTKSFVDRAREKRKSRLTTVVFAKPPHKNVDGQLIHIAKHQPKEPVDYLMPLFLTQSKTQQPLEQLITTAHKTITTSNAYVPIHESQTCRILKRIYSLQSQDKWALRQPKRAPEPTRPTTHWDLLLKEMKWMRTDFREERKWKHAAARNLAYACAEFVAASAEDRKLLQVNATIPPLPAKAEAEVEKTDSADTDMSDVPDLVQAKEEDSPLTEFDDEQVNVLDTVAPAEIFGLGPDDVVFPLQPSDLADRLLKELPMYGSPLEVPETDVPLPTYDPDKIWKRPALPITRFVEGKIELKTEEPRRKTSRYDYALEDDDDEDTVVVSADGSQKAALLPEMTDVALFAPENKHMRDRLHWSHQFRPPSEHPMPTQAFFECRHSSQWTWAEDDELKALVQKYPYNWSLISSMLTSRSLFISAAERRTPWECFERWISLEGLPGDMQKTPYFRLYTNRMEAAQKNLQAQAAQAPPPTAGNAVAPVRRRSTATIRVERRRNSKHLTLVDAMRKLAKKRETTLQKQQHAAGLAAMRKQTDTNQPRPPTHTPQEFSRLKHERELALQERLVVLQQRQEQQRRALLQSRQQQQGHGMPGQQQARTPGIPNGATPGPGQMPGNPTSLNVPSQARPHTAGQPNANGLPPQSQIPNGVAGTPQMPIKGLPQGLVPSMQGMQGLQNQQRLATANGTPDLQMVLQAQRISAQQRQAVQHQQNTTMQGAQAHNSQAIRNNLAMTQQALLQNGQMLANGAFPATPGANGHNAGATAAAVAAAAAAATSSPRVANPQIGLPPGIASHAQIANLEAQLHAKFPTASPEQLRRMVAETVQKTLHAQQQRQLSQSAMHAAAGGASATLPGQPLPSGIHQSPQLYAQMLRQQQAQQARQQQQSQAQGQQANGQPNQAAGPNGAAHPPVTNGQASQASPTTSQAQPQAPSQTPKTPQLAQAQAQANASGVPTPHSRSASVGSGVGK